MLQKLLNVFRIPELRNKLLFTLAMLVVYRIGFYVPLPGVNAPALYEMMNTGSEGGYLGQISNYLSTFSGGSLGQSTIFGLGIMPYISASIILQLMGTVVPSLEKLKKEGEPGMRKINEWTRYLTVGVCFVQALMWVQYLLHSNPPLIYNVVRDHYAGLFTIMGVIVLTAGSVFLMWLGEQIDEYGIGNGVSLIITAGIISRMPFAITYIYERSPFGGLIENVLGGLFTGDFKRINTAFSNVSHNFNNTPVHLPTMIFLICCFIFVVAGAIFLTQAQRRIRVQQAKHMRGRRVYGGQSQYLPLRVNHGGVMPIIFASSLMMLPIWGLGFLRSHIPAASIDTWWAKSLGFITTSIGNGSWGYEVLFCAMIFFFSFFWNTVQFQPKEMANQLRDYGSFVPGLRPGKRTADYLENVMFRITYVGAAFLCVIAVIPSVAASQVLGGGKPSPQDFQVAQFLGGTSLLIVIQVMLDFVNRIEANLVMRNYGGFSDSDGGGSGAKIRRPKGGPVRGPKQPQPSPFDSGSPKGLPA